MDFLAALKNLKNKVLKSDLELKLKELVGDEPTPNFIPLIDEICSKTHNKDDLESITKFINKKLSSKKWKRILRTLKLVSFLIKGSSKELISNLKYEKMRLEGLTKYFAEENGAYDIREQATLILDYLNDDKKLQEERDNYAKTKKVLEIGKKRESGGLLNSIGTFNPSKSNFSDKTFGLDQLSIDTKGGNKELNYNKSSPSQNKNKNSFKFSGGKENKQESESSDESSDDKYQEGYTKNINNKSSNPPDFDEIFASSKSPKENQPNGKINLLSMNDLFSDEPKKEDINDIFDFTK